MSDTMEDVTPQFTFGGVTEYNAEYSDSEEGEMEVPMRPVSGRRTTVSAEVYNRETESEEFQPTVHEKSEEDNEVLTEALINHYLFKHLDDRELAQVVSYFEPRTFEAGDYICEEGESAEHSLFHVILAGDCSVQVDGQEVGRLEAPCTFGETEMMYNTDRTESVVALSTVYTFSINRPTYQRTLHNTFADKREMYCHFLKNVKFLEGLSHSEMVQLADCLQPSKFQAGEVLIPCDAPPECMYIIVEGVVKVVGRTEEGEKIDVCEFARGAIVGELEFLHDHYTVADVIAVTEEVRVARLERNHFELCMGPLKDILKESRAEDPVYSYYKQKRQSTTISPTNAHAEPSLTDYQELKDLYSHTLQDFETQIQVKNQELKELKEVKERLELQIQEMRLEAQQQQGAWQRALDEKTQEIARLKTTAPRPSPRPAPAQAAAVPAAPVPVTTAAPHPVTCLPAYPAFAPIPVTQTVVTTCPGAYLMHPAPVEVVTTAPAVRYARPLSRAEFEEVCRRTAENCAQGTFILPHAGLL